MIRSSAGVVLLGVARTGSPVVSILWTAEVVRSSGPSLLDWLQVDRYLRSLLARELRCSVERPDVCRSNSLYTVDSSSGISYSGVAVGKG